MIKYHVKVLFFVKRSKKGYPNHRIVALYGITGFHFVVFKSGFYLLIPRLAEAAACPEDTSMFLSRPPVLDGGGSAAFAVSAKVMIASTCPTIRKKDAQIVFLISFAGQVFKGKKVQNTVRFKKIKYFCSVRL